jgi:hypothetical protein
MHRFAATSLARGFLMKASAGAKGKEAHHGDAAESYRGILLAFCDLEMAEQVVSDVLVQECVLRCGSPWRGCGIPADDICLLAMQAAARPAVSLPVPVAPQAPGHPLSSTNLTAGNTSPASPADLAAGRQDSRQLSFSAAGPVVVIRGQDAG